MEHVTHTAAQLGPLATQAAGYLWLIPLFPLLGAFINAAFGLRLQRRFGKGMVHGHRHRRDGGVVRHGGGGLRSAAAG